jgi:hypothetical protein
VINASIRIVKNNAIVINGSKTLRFLNPGIESVLRVINKFVKLIVVVTPAKITAVMIISCPPIPVNFVLEEYGVIKVQPDKVNVLLEHLVT